MGKGRAALRVVLIFVIIAVAGYFLSGPLFRFLNLGLDLQGGVHVLLQARGENISGEDMSNLQEVMRRRVDEMGVAEPLIQRSAGNRLIVELAGVKDPEQAVKAIGRTAMLEFKTADGQVILTGKDLKTAKATIDTNTNRPEINLQFNSEGSKKFGEVTARLVRDYPAVNGVQDSRRNIAIYLDNETLTNPYVEEPISGGQARITGTYTFDEAVNLAALLRGGALPLSVEIIEKRTVGPTLGQDSLEKSQIAIIVGLLAIALYMLLVYRVPGIIAIFSLVVYALIVLGVLAGLQATLTLPAIAGLLLSVGMAVDANIIIYERIKDELRNGKTLRAAVESGFRRAFWTIFDANVTTILAAMVLYYFGTGPIRGFAVTLSIGILASMFTAITLTRWLLRHMIQVSFLQNRALYGISRGGGIG